MTVRLYGEDHHVLRTQAEDLRKNLADVSGVASSRVVLPVDEPTLEIEVDLNSAQRYGVKPGDVRRTAAILLSGIHAGSLFEDQKIYDIVVWGARNTRNNLSDIRNLLIDTPGGGHVRLDEVADVRIVSSPTVIRHDAASAYLDIVFNIEDRNGSAVAADVNAAIKKHPFPLEYHAGNSERRVGRRRSRRRGAEIRPGRGIVISYVTGASLARRLLNSAPTVSLVAC